MQELEKIVEEIAGLKEMYKASAFSLLDKGNLPCEYDKSDIESEKVQALSEAIAIIRKHMNDGWIPVDERLSTMEEYQKDDGRAILDDGNRRYAGYFDVYTEKFYRYRHVTAYRAELYEDNGVITWRPLPEPYSPEFQNAFSKLLEEDAKGKIITLACFCGYEPMCHRSILKELYEQARKENV